MLESRVSSSIEGTEHPHQITTAIIIITRLYRYYLSLLPNKHTFPPRPHDLFGLEA